MMNRRDVPKHAFLFNFFFLTDDYLFVPFFFYFQLGSQPSASIGTRNAIVDGRLVERHHKSSANETIAIFVRRRIGDQRCTNEWQQSEPDTGSFDVASGRRQSRFCNAIFAEKIGYFRAGRYGWPYMGASRQRMQLVLRRKRARSIAFNNNIVLMRREKRIFYAVLLRSRVLCIFLSRFGITLFFFPRHSSLFEIVLLYVFYLHPRYRNTRTRGRMRVIGLNLYYASWRG